MKFENIKTVFFDLDNTLLDHNRAEKTALLRLMQQYPEIFHLLSSQAFLEVYHKINLVLWRKYGEGEISAEELRLSRFQLTLRQLNARNDRANELSESYFEIYSRQAFVLPNAEKILKFLSRKYQLGILSNGFTATQERKLKNTQFESYFVHKVYSCKAGAMKPAKQIFDYARDCADAQANELIYVGDSYEIDIQGAKSAGWYAVYFNPHGSFPQNGQADVEIRDLLELRDLL